ncbi:MAG: hypothetical protein ABIP29_03205, partial [Candidatus Eisenbacteria bacterium]
LVLSVKAWLQDQDDVTLAEWTAGRNRARAMAAEAEKAEAANALAKGEHKATGDDESPELADLADLPEPVESVDDSEA